MKKLPFLFAALALATAGCSVGTSRPRAEGPNYAAGPGYVPGNAPAGAAAGKHYFEGFIQWRGTHGKPPGEAFDMSCEMRREDLLCNVRSADPSLPVQIGFRGPGNTLCVRVGHSPAWMPVSFATIGFLFSLLPADMRKKAVTQTQAQYRWTGRTDSVLGYRCRELEDRSDEGLRLTCYSPDEFFEGDQKLVPIMHQMGFDPGFVSSLSGGGIGWRSAEWKKDGTPEFFAEAVRIEPRPVHPATFGGVCGMP